MRILVTGANGFVGLSLIQNLLNAGFTEITVIVRNKSRIIDKFGSALSVIESDLRFLSNELRLEYEIVIHLAATTRALNYAEYYSGNVFATERLLSSIDRKSCKQFIYVSSQAIFGPSTETPLDEDSLVNPISDYGKTKYLAELLVQNSGLPFTILRPCSIYGPGSHEFLPFLKMTNNHIQVVIGDGLNMFNLLYIRDFIEVIRLVLNNKNTFNNTYNITDGNTYSWLDITKSASEAFQKKCILIKLPIPLVNILGTVFDLAAKITNWKPLLNSQKLNEMKAKYQLMNNLKICNKIYLQKFVKLDDGLKHSYEWYCNNKQNL